MKAQVLIDHYHMAKILDEGCWFAISYRSPLQLPAHSLPGALENASRVAGSAIYALITAEDFSAMHRLAQDETWHFYCGDPIELLLLHPDGRGEAVLLGTDIVAGQNPQYTVPAGTWMGARPQRKNPDAFSFFGCTLVPGFEDKDYEPGYCSVLQASYPEYADAIKSLTRTDFA